jgi:ABC-type dipeptide/oligopeptide/nickel transport system permease subunit
MRIVSCIHMSLRGNTGLLRYARNDSREIFYGVMLGLVPGIHRLLYIVTFQMDCRNKSGNDDRDFIKRWHWLGTDDQGRDVLARLIYGFRLSVLFGLTLTIISSVIGIAAGAVQGYFGGWTDLLFQRFIEIWTSIPSLYLLLIFSAFFVPGFLDAAVHPAAFQLGCACGPGACGVSARAQP